jgi:hypothetical protein
MMTETPNLLMAIEEHLKASGTSATTFGWDVAKDPNLVHQLRNGRKVRASMATRIMDHIQRAERQRRKVAP